MRPAASGPPGGRIDPPLWYGRPPGGCRCEKPCRFRVVASRGSRRQARPTPPAAKFWTSVSTEIASLRGFRLIGSGVVAATRANGQLPRCVHRDLDLAKRPVHIAVGGSVLDGVLIANVVGHYVCDGFHFGNFLGKVDLATGGFGQSGKLVLRLVGVGAVFFLQQSDGI